MINSGIAISEPKKTNSPKPVKYHKMSPWFSNQLARFDKTPAIIANKSEGETLSLISKDAASGGDSPGFDDPSLNHGDQFLSILKQRDILKHVTIDHKDVGKFAYL